MEHRWSRRCARRGDVMLGHLQHGLVRGALDNISLGGMFVETRSDLFRKNAPVVVSFELERAGGKQRYRLPAMVARTAGHGIGLMFLDTPLHTLRSLREILYGDGAQPATFISSPESRHAP